jgi:starvation-inducible DNA-binding protein
MSTHHSSDRAGAPPSPLGWFSWGNAACGACIPALNQLLADSIMLRDLYGEHRWQVAGGDFYPQHLLFDRHCLEQSGLADRIAERIVTLGGAPVVMAQHVAEMTRIARPPTGRESPSGQIARLLVAHDAILSLSHDIVDLSARLRDMVTGALIAEEVIRVSEFQVWHLLEHKAGIPFVEHGADEALRPIEPSP